jgi:hypothetical protein
LRTPITSSWGRTGLAPVETSAPAPEFKPLFTVRDQSEGTVYYTVSWTQRVVDIGTGIFPATIGTANVEAGAIEYAENASIAKMAPWLPAEVTNDA